MSEVNLFPDELRSYLESEPEPHILVDREHRIFAANSAYRDKRGDS